MIYHDKSWLEDKYIVKQWSTQQIANFCGVTQATIYKWIKKYNIPTRDFVECHTGKLNGAWIDSPLKNYQWLYEKYVLEKKTYRQIADESEASLRTVARWIKIHEIIPRQGSESIVVDRTGTNNPNYKGAQICPVCGNKKTSTSTKCQECYFNFLRENPVQNPNYKGNTDFISNLRSYLKSTWREEILKRDKKQCVECGSVKELNIHHIVPFHLIKDQLILEYNDLDLTNKNDMILALERAKKDPRINDMNNGITLCKKCHYGEHARIKQHSDDQIYRYYAEVIKVLDADTIRLNVDLGFNIKKQIDLRLFAVNAYETNSKNDTKYLGIKGKHILKSICPPGRRVIIRTYKPGKYGGRWLGLLFIDHLHFNKALLTYNLAEEYLL